MSVSFAVSGSPGAAYRVVWCRPER